MGVSSSSRLEQQQHNKTHRQYSNRLLLTPQHYLVGGRLAVYGFKGERYRWNGRVDRLAVSYDRNLVNRIEALRRLKSGDLHFNYGV